MHRSQPVLVVGQSGGGKTEEIANAARELNWPYLSIALGSATIESLIGSFVLDSETGTFEFRKGVLVRAMEEGYAIVLEELNMADSGIIEVLNEYFDRGVLTIQDQNVSIHIHSNFRLFATMNPTEGRTGRNAGRIPLSPALRSRFREVWMRSERNKGEQYRMMLGGIHSLVSELIARGLPEEAPEMSGYDKTFPAAQMELSQPAVETAVKPGVFVRAKGGDGDSHLGAVLRMAKASDEGASAKPTQRAWEQMSQEERKNIFEEQFRIVSHGRMNIVSSEEYFGGREHAWAYAPSINTLIYNSQEIMTLSLDALIGVAVHESMHRYGTRYTSLFADFLNAKSLAGSFFNILEDGRIENWARYHPRPHGLCSLLFHLRCRQRLLDDVVLGQSVFL